MISELKETNSTPLAGLCLLYESEKSDNDLDYNRICIYSERILTCINMNCNIMEIAINYMHR